MTNECSISYNTLTTEKKSWGYCLSVGRMIQKSSSSWSSSTTISGVTPHRPPLREISSGTGIPHATVQRYLVAMDEDGKLEYDGKRIGTAAAQKMTPVNCMRVLGRVACGPGDEEQEEVLEYIRMPENLVGKGTFFALIAKGDSMIDAGIHEGDYVIVRQTQTAEIGDIVVALYDNLSNLKVLGFDEKKEQYYLCSRNPDKKKYADIYVTDLQVQGIAVGVYHKLKG